MADLAGPLSKPSITPSKPSLLALPAEIRLAIYRHIFGKPPVPTPFHLLRTLEPTALFSTCKPLRNESLIEYYEWLKKLLDQVDNEKLKEPLPFTVGASIPLDEIFQMVRQWEAELGEAKDHTFDLYQMKKMVGKLRRRTHYKIIGLKRI